MLTLRKMENVPTGQNNRPKLVVKITGMFLPLSQGFAISSDPSSQNAGRCEKYYLNICVTYYVCVPVKDGQL
jgi:hypothetical protein